MKVKGNGDENHLNACKKAIETYANEIKPYIPQLSDDLIKKYLN